MLQCIICQPASLDCQDICRSTTSAVWPYYCVIIKWTPGGSIAWTLSLTNRFFCSSSCSSLKNCYYLRIDSVYCPVFGPLLYILYSLILSTVMTNWRAKFRVQSFLSSSLLLLWECWMLHFSVLHPFNAKKPNKEVSLSRPAHWQTTSGWSSPQALFFFIYMYLSVHLLSITFNFLPRCYVLPSPVM